MAKAVKKKGIKKVTEKPTTITSKQLKKLQADLRDYDIKWVGRLLEKIKSNKTLPEHIVDQIDERKIYNVFNGVTRAGAWKLTVYKHAIELKEELQKEWTVEKTNR